MGNISNFILTGNFFSINLSHLLLQFFEHYWGFYLFCLDSIHNAEALDMLCWVIPVLGIYLGIIWFLLHTEHCNVCTLRRHLQSRKTYRSVSPNIQYFSATTCRWEFRSRLKKLWCHYLRNIKTGSKYFFIVLYTIYQCCGSGMFIPDPGSYIKKRGEK
jgi:hypothetical protein